MDAYSKYEEVINDYWKAKGASNESRAFYGVDGIPDLNFELLEKIISKSVADSDTAQSGGLARGLDMWIAEELRAAGFITEEIWPRLHEPRVINPSVSHFISKLPSKLATECSARLDKAGSATANVQGAVYQKQIDVGMSSWLTGPEILISTKTMSGAYGKNLSNRFEEAYGDAMNLRKRFPLAAIGFFFLMNAKVLDSPGDLSKAITMLRKLQEEDGVYDVSALLLVDWSSGKAIIPDQSKIVPRALSAPLFFHRMIDLTIVRGAIGTHQVAADKANIVSVNFSKTL